MWKLQTHDKKITQWNGKNIWIDTSQKKTCKWPIIATSLASEKWKFKLQWNASFHLLEWLYSRNVSRMWTHQSFHTLLVGMKNVVIILENCLEVPHNIKYTSPLWSCHATPSPKKWKHTHRKTCTRIFIAALCIIFPNWKLPKCLLAGEKIYKWWYIYTVDYDLAKNRNKSFTHATSWMDVKNLSSKKLDTKDYIQYASIYMKFKNRQN